MTCPTESITGESPFAPLVLSNDGYFNSYLWNNGDLLEFPCDNTQTDLYDGPPIFDEELTVISEEQIFKNDDISIVLPSGISLSIDHHVTHTYLIDGQYQDVIRYDAVSMDVNHIFLDQSWQLDSGIVRFMPYPPFISLLSCYVFEIASSIVPRRLVPLLPPPAPPDKCDNKLRLWAFSVSLALSF